MTTTERKTAPPITALEMTEAEIEFAERIGARLGFKQMAYTSTSGLWGMFCLPDHANHKHGCVILTKEFGFLFVADLEDLQFARLGGRRKEVDAMNAEIFIADIPTATARAAYAGISFTPEKRAEQVRDGYAAELANDYAELEKLTSGKPGMLEVLQDEFARYREGYRARYLKKLASDSRCISWMITGPANFPSARNEKRNRVAHKRLEELLEFRTRALAAIRKTLCPELRPIMAGDADATQRLQAEIDTAEKNQEFMKSCNAAIRKNWSAGQEAVIAALLAVGCAEALAREMIQPGRFGGMGYASFSLTNNSANIRRMKGRLTVIARNQSTPASDYQGSAATVEDCPAENRVRLTFPGKPSVEIRTRLKQSGFRWAPSLGVWQAYRHQHTIALAKEIAQ